MPGDDCVFSAVVAGGERSHVVLDEPDIVAFLDHRPVFKGHVLVIPRGHVVTLPDLPAGLLEPLFGAVARCCTAMVDALGAEGSWVAENNIVSQAVPHLHVHVVPADQGRRPARASSGPARSTRARPRWPSTRPASGAPSRPRALDSEMK